MKWKVLSSKVGFDTPWFKVLLETVELPDGKVIDDYSVWAEKDVVHIFAVTKDGKILLVKQYKHGAQEELIEFPAGYIDENEPPEVAARRELQEETGHNCEKLTKFFETHSNPTKSRARYYYFLAEECYLDEENVHQQDDTEDIELLTKSPEELFALLIENEIKAPGSIATGFMGLQKLNLISFTQPPL